MECFQNVSKSSKSSKNEQKFYCAICDYTTSRKYNYTKHLSSQKHFKKCFQNVSKSSKSSKKSSKKKIVNNYVCEFCDKIYKNRSGLWKHKRCCKMKLSFECEEKKENNIDNKNLVLEMFELNKKHGAAWQTLCKENNKQYEKIHKEKNKIIEKQDKLIKEQFNIIKDLSKNPKQIINNNTQNISINVFLNDYCKNAMNLTDFVNNLKVTLEDMHRTNQIGLTDGITNIFLEGLNDLSAVERPIHCVDKKRGKFYIKDDNKWHTDNNKIGTAMHNVKIKHIHKLKEWEDKHPNFQIPGHPNNKPWTKLVDTVTKDLEIKEQKKLLKKIQDSVSFKETWKNLQELREKI